MKDLKFFRHILSAVLFTYSIYGANVTFNVDMQFETVENGVWIAGGDAGNPGHEMLDSDSDGIYSVTLELANNAGYGYKFVNGPIDAGWQGAWEVVPPACSFGDFDDRRVEVGETDMNLADVVFGDCSPNGQTTVVFQVDMQYEILTNGVWIAGGNAGNPGYEMHPISESSTIFARTISIPENTAYGYKFVNGPIDGGWQGGWEEVPAACGFGEFLDRSVDVGTEDTTLPAIVFGTCDEAVTEVDVTFHVDMQFETVDNGVWLAGGNAGNPGYEMLFISPLFRPSRSSD